MKTRTMINRLFAMVVLTGILAFSGYGLTPPGEPRAPNAVKALLLVDDLYGSSLNIEDSKNNILENFSSYGWDITVASCNAEVSPSQLAIQQGCEVLRPDMRTNELDNALDWDVIVIAPGESYDHLAKCPFVLNALALARVNSIPVVAWCKGVQVLAAADVVQGLEITGHPDYTEEYLAAGAKYKGNVNQPIEDQMVITCRDEEFRQEMCELIRQVVETSTFMKEGAKLKMDKIDIQLNPNPIKTSSCIHFSIDEVAIVHIAVFDQQGNMVQDVVKQQFLAGNHKVTFSPTSLRTGIYYVYIFSQGSMGMQKCMII